MTGDDKFWIIDSRFMAFAFLVSLGYFLRYSFLGVEREIGDDLEDWLTGFFKLI